MLYYLMYIQSEHLGWGRNINIPLFQIFIHFIFGSLDGQERKTKNQNPLPSPLNWPFSGFAWNNYLWNASLEFFLFYCWFVESLFEFADCAKVTQTLSIFSDLKLEFCIICSPRTFIGNLPAVTYGERKLCSIIPRSLLFVKRYIYIYICM